MRGARAHVSGRFTRVAGVWGSATTVATPMRISAPRHRDNAHALLGASCGYGPWTQVSDISAWLSRGQLWGCGAPRPE